jgi:phosphatidate cytidylyltransferase
MVGFEGLQITAEMTLFFIVMAVHFLLGAAGVAIYNRRLPQGDQKKNWLKFFWYLIIFSIVTVSVICGRYTFLAVSVIIFSLCSTEALSAANGTGLAATYNGMKMTVILLTVLVILMVFYSVFFFLPLKTVLFTYAIVIIFDGASQIFGQLTGRYYIKPSVIPGKTWEGFIGGSVSALVTAVILKDMVLLSPLPALITGLIICVSAFFGDLGASAIKRKLMIKDFSNLLPGQGGFLDRFDSFIAAGSMIGLYSLFFSRAGIHVDADLAYYLLFSVLFLIIMFSGDLLYTLFKVKAEFSRIFTHFAVGIACLFFYETFTSCWFVIAICIQSALFIIFSGIAGVLRSHHGIRRKTIGSVLFFAGVLCSFMAADLLNDKYLFYLPVSVLAVSDPLAAVVGMKINSKKWPPVFATQGSYKTVAGSAAFFISSALIMLAGFSLYIGLPFHYGVLLSLFIAFIVTMAEAVSIYGTDNLSVPLASLLMLIWLL